MHIEKQIKRRNHNQLSPSGASLESFLHKMAPYVMRMAVLIMMYCCFLDEPRMKYLTFVCSRSIPYFLSNISDI